MGERAVRGGDEDASQATEDTAAAGASNGAEADGSEAEESDDATGESSAFGQRHNVKRIDVNKEQNDLPTKLDSLLYI